MELAQMHRQGIHTGVLSLYTGIGPSGSFPITIRIRLLQQPFRRRLNTLIGKHFLFRGTQPLHTQSPAMY